MYEHAVLTACVVGAICYLLWIATLIACPRRIVDDQYAVPDDRRTPEQVYREAGE